MKIKFYILFLCLTSNIFVSANWSPVGGGMNGTILDLCADTSNSKLYAGGSFTFAGNTFSPFIASWNGSAWESLSTGMNGPVYALCMYNGNLYAGGRFTQAGSVAAKNIAKWNGSAWEALGSGFDSTVYSMTVFANELYIGGVFKKSGSLQTGFCAKWNDSQIQKVGTSTTTGITNAYLNAPWQGVYDLKVFKNVLYIAGAFDSINHVRSYPIIKWDGFNFGKIITNSTILFSLGELNNMIWFASEGLVQAYDGSGFQPLYFQVEPSDEIWDMVTYNGKLILGGTYSNIINNNSLKYITTWDGTNISLLGNSINNGVSAVEIFNGDIYIGGSFTNVSSSATDNIAKLSGSVVTSIDNNIAQNSKINVLQTPSFSNTFLLKSGNDYISSAFFPLRFDVVNMKGEIVYSTVIESFSNTTTVEGNSINQNGMYFIQIIDKNLDLLHSSKVVIQKK